MDKPIWRVQSKASTGVTNLEVESQCIHGSSRSLMWVTGGWLAGLRPSD
jgi:hypothetical protein